MPSGRRHSICTAVIAASSASALFLYSPSAALWCGTGALAGLLITPDADLGVNISHHYIRKYLGVPAELVWRVIWKPYAMFCSHRGFLSHGYIVSTVIRLLYLGLWILPFWYWLKLPPIEFRPWMGWMFVGLLLSDISHSAMDAADKLLGGRL